MRRAPSRLAAGALPGLLATPPAAALPGLLLVAWLVLGRSSAMAAPWDLRVRALSALPPTSLRMRPAARAAAAAATPDAAGPAVSGGDAGGEPGAALERARRLRRLRDRQPVAEPPLSDKVTFRFNVGFGLDGGQHTGEAGLAGNTCDMACLQRFEQLRLHGFGDAVIGSRGLGARSLSTYFAAQFRFDQDLRGRLPAVPSVYDGEGVDEVQVRSLYGDIDGLFESRWLRPLYVRIGRQYRYGPAVAHFDGISAGYHTRAVSIGSFFGTGVQLYQRRGGRRLRDRGMAGLSLRVDLSAMERAPLVVTANYLRFAGQEHSDLALAVRWSRDVTARLGVRSRNDATARAYAHLRARLSRVTIAVFELVHRTEDDWLYDLFPGDPDPGAARAYLSLEPPGPRTHLSARAGTVLLDNVDLLVRGTAALEHGEPDQDPSTPDATFASSYLEGGAALELRLQRTLSLGLSGLIRGYAQREAADPGEDASVLLRLEDRGHARERGFVEGGSTLRFSLGARQFSAQAEVYARFYSRAPLLDVPGLPDEDDRIGGRMSVESWAGERLRLRAEYDVTTTLDVVPELTGFKSLRVLMEGRY